MKGVDYLTLKGFWLSDHIFCFVLKWHLCYFVPQITGIASCLFYMALPVDFFCFISGSKPVVLTFPGSQPLRIFDWPRGSFRDFSDPMKPIHVLSRGLCMGTRLRTTALHPSWKECCQAYPVRWLLMWSRGGRIWQRAVWGWGGERARERLREICVYIRGRQVL